MQANAYPVPFTLHVRLTRFCNAGCDYCSSWQESPDNKMSVSNYLDSLDFIYSTWEKLGLKVTDLTIEYVGGEILLLSKSEINDCVMSARDFFKARGISVYDGAQSNLIGTSDRIGNLFDLFEGRVGTSIDTFSDKRKFKGSAKKYKTIFIHNESRVIEKTSKKVPAVFTVDSDTLGTALDELDLAMTHGRDLMVRPVFGGGSAVSTPDVKMLGEMYDSAIRKWWMNADIRFEPVFSLLRKRLNNKYGSFSGENFDYCSFQSNCAVRSMSLEPNGEIYICQDMADASRKCLGNALLGEFDMALWFQINMRPARLSDDCYQCDYFKECQGGCMLKSLEDGFDIYGKSSHCYSWKRIFGTIDQLIAESGHKNVLEWIEVIESKQ